MREIDLQNTLPEHHRIFHGLSASRNKIVKDGEYPVEIFDDLVDRGAITSQVTLEGDVIFQPLNLNDPPVNTMNYESMEQ